MEEKVEWNGRLQVLSLDGGGIKGLFSAAILAAFEEDTGTRIQDHFDLIVGTSTGGIISLALGLGRRPSEIVELYGELGSTVFGDPLWMRRVQHWVRRKYGHKNLERVLKQAFGEATLASSAKRLVVPSYSLDGDEVYLFKTPHHPRLKRDYRECAWKVGLATAAAPTYFPAYSGVGSVRLIDGGVWANNPVLVGIAEACSLLGASIEDVHVLSIGTTNEVVKRSSWLSWAGLLGWAGSATDLIMRGQSVGATNMARHLLGERLVRVDAPVAGNQFALDKLDARGLVARASQVSRVQLPDVERVLFDHTARPYEPIYTSEN